MQRVLTYTRPHNSRTHKDLRAVNQHRGGFVKSIAIRFIHHRIETTLNDMNVYLRLSNSFRKESMQTTDMLQQRRLLILTLATANWLVGERHEIPFIHAYHMTPARPPLLTSKEDLFT